MKYTQGSCTVMKIISPHMLILISMTSSSFNSMFSINFDLQEPILDLPKANRSNFLIPRKNVKPCNALRLEAVSAWKERERRNL